MATYTASVTATTGSVTALLTDRGGRKTQFTTGLLVGGYYGDTTPKLPEADVTCSIGATTGSVIGSSAGVSARKILVAATVPSLLTDFIGLNTHVSSIAATTGSIVADVNVGGSETGNTWFNYLHWKDPWFGSTWWAESRKVANISAITGSVTASSTSNTNKIASVAAQTGSVISSTAAVFKGRTDISVAATTGSATASATARHSRDISIAGSVGNVFPITSSVTAKSVRVASISTLYGFGSVEIPITDPDTGESITDPITGDVIQDVELNYVSATASANANLSENFTLIDADIGSVTASSTVKVTHIASVAANTGSVTADIDSTNGIPLITGITATTNSIAASMSAVLNPEGWPWKDKDDEDSSWNDIGDETSGWSDVSDKSNIWRKVS